MDVSGGGNELVAGTRVRVLLQGLLTALLVVLMLAAAALPRLVLPFGIPRANLVQLLAIAGAFLPVVLLAAYFDSHRR